MGVKAELRLKAMLKMPEQFARLRSEPRRKKEEREGLEATVTNDRADCKRRVFRMRLVATKPQERELRKDSELWEEERQNFWNSLDLELFNSPASSSTPLTLLRYNQNTRRHVHDPLKPCPTASLPLRNERRWSHLKLLKTLTTSEDRCRDLQRLDSNLLSAGELLKREQVRDCPRLLQPRSKTPADNPLSSHLQPYREVQ